MWTSKVQLREKFTQLLSFFVRYAIPIMSYKLNIFGKDELYV